MRIYLDNCTFNRPFDDQSQIRVRLEAEAKLFIQDQIKNDEVKLVWSYILDFENEQNPFAERRSAILKWRELSSIDVQENPALLEMARKLNSLGVKPKDALHISSAIEAKAACFLTTDDILLKKLKNFDEIQVMNPTEFIRLLDNYDD